MTKIFLFAFNGLFSQIMAMTLVFSTQNGEKIFRKNSQCFALGRTHDLHG